MKSNRLFICILLALSLVLTACSGPAPTASPSGAQPSGESSPAPKSGEKVVVRAIGAGFGTETATTDPVSKVTIQGYDVVEKAYETAFPNIDLQLTGVPWDNWQAKLQSAAAANQVDVLVHGASMTDLVDDLTPYVTKEPEYFQKLLINGAIRRPIKDDYTRQVITGIPITIACSTLQYDKKIFDDFGVQYPDEKWTWDDVLAAAQKMTGKNSRTGEDTYGFYFDGNNTDAMSRVHTSYLYAHDFVMFEFKDKQMDSITHYDTPESIQALDWYYKLSLTCPKSFVEGRGNENFGTDKNNVAMVVDQGAVVLYNKTLSLGTQERYGYSYPPVVEKGGSGWADFTGDWNMAIIKNAKNKEESWNFIKWMASDPGIADWNWKRGNMPNSKEGMDNLVKTGIPFAKIYFDSMEAYPKDLFLGTCRYFDGFFGASKSIITTHLSGMFAGKETPEQAGKGMQKDFEDQAKSFK